jgi:hypothetical protein
MRFYTFVLRVFRLRNSRRSINAKNSNLLEDFVKSEGKPSDGLMQGANKACIKSVTSAENVTNIEFDKAQYSYLHDFEQIDESPKTLYSRLKRRIHALLHGSDMRLEHDEELSNRESIVSAFPVIALG